MKKTNILFELRGFLLLWFSQAVSSLGTAMTDFALIIWIYNHEGTATSVTLLTLCAFMPTILFRFAAGAIVDSMDQKKVMIAADCFAALGTAAVLLLDSVDALRIWHIYLINVLLSFMNAFQAPAAFAATSLLVPKEHYAKAGGLQGFSGAAVSILAPALGGMLLSFGGLQAVLLCDLLSFCFAVFTLLFLIRLPKRENKREQKPDSFWQNCLEGIRFLKKNKPLMRLILMMTIINFLAKLGGDGMLAPFVLSRGGSQQVLGVVQSSVAIGLLLGSLITMLMKPVTNKTGLLFVTLALTFSGNVLMSLSQKPWVWCAACLLSYVSAAVMNAHLSVIMRENIPMELQGRVYSAKDTLQNGAIPLGLILSGFLADHVFTPAMEKGTPVQMLFSPLFGREKGAGIALMFFAVGIAGMLISLTRLRKPYYRSLNGKENVSDPS